MLLRQIRSQFSSIPLYFTMDPWQLSEQHPYQAQNLIRGRWRDSQHYQTIIDPLNGDKFITVPDTQDNRELQEVIDSMKSCPISGLHNPLKNPERYQLYGEVIHSIATEMKKKEVHAFFTKLIQRVAPKSEIQASGEVTVTRRFFENFGGDQPRFLMRSFNVPGDHNGQQSTGYRWPYGAVGLVTPFNFPMEIPVLQMFGALMTGNKVFFKGDNRVNVVVEQFLRMCINLGMPATDVEMIFANGQATEHVLTNSNLRNVLFTGSSKVGEHLCQVLKGKINLEDAGFDWKILGPDVPNEQGVDYVAWQCDQDAYACSGQKCSAQSILFAHENWVKQGLYEKLKQLASTRNLKDLTVGPILTWNNSQIKEHIDKLLSIPGAKLLFGGIQLKDHSIPECYGSYEPTAIFVPMNEILDEKNFDLVTTELFGPFQIITQYQHDELSQVLDVINTLKHHLTAGVVSNDINFIRSITANTVNGVTYTGLRARTTGAPQNHWFGPCGDPRAAGIGTPEAIIKVWTSHREIILDTNEIDEGWKGQQS